MLHQHSKSARGTQTKEGNTRLWRWLFLGFQVSRRKQHLHPWAHWAPHIQLKSFLIETMLSSGTYTGKPWDRWDRLYVQSWRYPKWSLTCQRDLCGCVNTHLGSCEAQSLQRRGVLISEWDGVPLCDICAWTHETTCILCFINNLFAHPFNSNTVYWVSSKPNVFVYLTSALAFLFCGANVILTSLMKLWVGKWLTESHYPYIKARPCT